MARSPSGRRLTTGRSTTAPTPSAPTWARLSMGVSNSAPRLPVSASVNVAPVNASGARAAARARVGEHADASGQSRQTQVVRVVNHRNARAARRVDGNAQVDGRVVDHSVPVILDRGVERCVLLERGHGRFGDDDAERQSRVGRHPGDVHLHHRGQVGRPVQRGQPVAHDHVRRFTSPGRGRHREDRAGGRGDGATYVLRRHSTGRAGAPDRLQVQPGLGRQAAGSRRVDVAVRGDRNVTSATLSRQLWRPGQRTG